MANRNFSPGWNDPPALSYNPSKPSGNVRNLLNKRVAFPLDTSPGGSNVNITSFPNAGNAQLTTHSSGNFYNTSGSVHNYNSYTNDNSSSLEHFNRSMSTPCFSQPYEQQTASYVNHTIPTNQGYNHVALPTNPLPFNTINSGVSTTQNYNVVDQHSTISPPQYSTFDIINVIQGAALGCVNMPKGTRENVERRIAALKISLETNCLSDKCRSKLCALVDNLSQQRYNDAYNVHSSMMIEHFNEVNSWMVGVKAIIMEYLKR